MVLLTEFCQIYILYFDDVIGLIPILIFSNEFIKKNEKQILPIKLHPIRLLDSENERDFEQINLKYNGKVYFAKRFKPKFNNKNFGKVFIILVLTKEINIYGSDLLNDIKNTIKKDFGYSLKTLIKSEILKESLIKTPSIVEIIKKGEIVKEDIRNRLKQIWRNYFDSIIYSYEKNQSNF